MSGLKPEERGRAGENLFFKPFVLLCFELVEGSLSKGKD
jgi:hypothetical protein